MSYTCVHCGQSGHNWYPHNSDACPALLQKKQNEILQNTLNLQKKQMKAQQRAQEDAENAAARNRQSGLGGTLGAFTDGFNSRANVTGGGTAGQFFRFFVNLFVVWPIQLALALLDAYRSFAEQNPELAKKINRFLLLLTLGIVALALITKGIQDLYNWADSYNYGLVGFWIVAVIVGGFISLMVLPLLFSQTARDRFKRSYEEGYNGTTQNLNSESHKDNH